MKNLITLFLATSFITTMNAQSVFPYERDWGSYVGGTGTLLLDQFFVDTSFHHDSQNNIYLNGQTTFVNTYPSSYYNQFIINGGNTVNTTNTTNPYTAKFSPSGQMLFGSYTINVSNTRERLLAIDQADNRYRIKRFVGQIANLATAGTWLQQNTSSTANFSYILTKYDSNDNMLWSTYLPNNVGNAEAYSLKIDSDFNIFILSGTAEEIPNLGTAGVFQQNFISYNISNNVPGTNSFITKLNSSGAKLWATYSVPGIIDLEVYNNDLYLIATYVTAMPGNFTDAGTFQSTIPANNLLFKFDATNGQKIWGTFYGTPPNPTMYTGSGITSLEVNSTGIYLIGDNEDIGLPTYFATAGAHKAQLTGGGDLFLSKFDFSGNRIWSTYFGSSSYDTLINGGNLTILGERIILSGSHYGGGNNISTSGAFLETIPNSSSSLTNMYFAEFDHNGNQKWCSYYGGSGNNLFDEQVNPELLSDGSLILWGSTGSPTGIGTEGAAYQFMTSPSAPQPFGFIAKFNLKNPLSTSDLVKNNDLQLYDNPNNGNFTISGSVLEKQKASLSVFDMSGKLIHQASFGKKKINQFNLQNKLLPGNHLLEVKSDKDEKIKVFKMTVK